MLTEAEAHKLLYELCVKLEDDPPTDVRSFTDAVFLAEGLDPSTSDRHLLGSQRR
jgi:hypothetical protein